MTMQSEKMSLQVTTVTPIIPAKVSVQYPYRAVICGEEHIVKGWRGKKLMTDKGSFVFTLLHGKYALESFRLFEVALLQPDEYGGWLLNGHTLRSLESLPMGIRLAGITDNEVFRVHKSEIKAVAWIKTNGESGVTKLLDIVLSFWKTAKHPTIAKPVDSTLDLLGQLAGSVKELLFYQREFASWGNPMWLTEFRSTGEKTPLSPEERRSARTAAKLEETEAQLRKAEAAASGNLREATLKWMRFDPPGMSADTMARIQRAVQMYSSNPEMRSLAKIADEFGVSRKTVSGWFKTFKKETGFKVVTFQRHESVRKHLQVNSEKEEEVVE